MNEKAPIIRTLALPEIQIASDLADSIYPSALYEPYEAFERKYLLHPGGVFGCFLGSRMVGYIFSHPWSGSEVVPLASVFQTLPADPDCYYIHDVAVAPEFRGRGLGHRLAESAIAHGKDKGFEKFMLVSVNQTDRFWQRLGFKTVSSMNYNDGVPAYKMIRQDSHHEL